MEKSERTRRKPAEIQQQLHALIIYWNGFCSDSATSRQVAKSLLTTGA